MLAQLCWPAVETGVGGGADAGGVGGVEPPVEPAPPPLFEGCELLVPPPADLCVEWCAGFVVTCPTAWCEVPEAVTCLVEGFETRDGCAFERWELCPGVDCVGTTTFCVGGRLECEPGPAIRGTCTDPEFARRAVAVTPSASGMSGSATRRATIQTGRPVRRSLADNGLVPLSRLSFPDVAHEYKKPGRTASQSRGLLSAVSGRFVSGSGAVARALPRMGEAVIS